MLHARTVPMQDTLCSDLCRIIITLPYWPRKTVPLGRWQFFALNWQENWWERANQLASCNLWKTLRPLQLALSHEGLQAIQFWWCYTIRTTRAVGHNHNQAAPLATHSLDLGLFAQLGGHPGECPVLALPYWVAPWHMANHFFRQPTEQIL